MQNHQTAMGDGIGANGSDASMAASVWQLPEVPATIPEGPGRSLDDIARRADLASRVAEIAEQADWTKAEVARRIGMPDGTFSQWFSGRYQGRLDAQNTKVENWLDAIEESSALEAAIPTSPGFFDTRISKEITDMLLSAQLLPTMNMISCEAGLGKTFTAQRYQSTKSNCWMVTISPHTKTIHGMLGEIAEAIGIVQPNAGKLVSTIGRRIQRRGAPTLLIIDEAQNLIDDAINQLRHFVDVYQCGVALLGNSENYSRFAGWGKGTNAKYGQLRRRILKRLNRTVPYKADIAAFIKAWGITDPKMAEFLTGVGMKAGALGSIDMTVKLAQLQARGDGREIELADLKAAWKNRDVEA